MTRHLALLAAATFSVHAAIAQFVPPDPSGFQGLLVETYYVADSVDASDLDGSSMDELNEGAVTYRVFVDMKPGYKLLTVGGFVNHPLTISTSTIMFNNDDRGEAWGTSINDIHLDKNTVAIDSWLSMGAASDAHWGIPKAEDPDGTLLQPNDGGSTGTPLLVNSTSSMGLALTVADGLHAPSVPPLINSVGTAPDMFDAGGSSSYSNDNFAWAVLGGVEGPDTTNRILIGQFTTDGTLEFCMNLWMLIPDTLVCGDPNCHDILEFYSSIQPSDTLGGGYAVQNQFVHPTLCFNSTSQQVDCLGVPGGSALPGTACDDGDPLSVDDTWTVDCICIGSVGIADAEAMPGVSVGPNPTRDLVRISISNAKGQRGLLTVRNAVGQQIMVMDLGILQGDLQRMVDLSTVANGVYTLELQFDQERSVHRVSKF